MQSPNTSSPIADSIQVGGSWPTYTWRKGKGDGSEDNHYWLSIGSASEPLDVDNDALIEIDPQTKFIKFYGTTEILNGVSFGVDSINGTSIVSQTITSDKLEPGIVIDGSITKLTTAQTIDGILFDGTGPVNRFVHCATKADNPNKTVLLSDFRLGFGATVTIKFDNGNTAQNPELDVNGTGSWPIYYNNQPITGTKITANHVYTFVYDNYHYDIVGDLLEQTVDTQVLVDPIDQQYDQPVNLVVTDKNQSEVTSLLLTDQLQYTQSTKTLTVDNIHSNLTGSWQTVNRDQTVIVSDGSAGIRPLWKYTTTDGVYAIAGTNNGLVVGMTSADDVASDVTSPTHATTLIDRNGNATFANTVTAQSFVGNATSATCATNDQLNRQIDTTYLTIDDYSRDKQSYALWDGGTFTGPVRVPAISTETNTIISTVGYVDAAVTAAVDKAKEEIIGTAGNFDNIAQLSTQVTTNTENIATLAQQQQNYVRYDQSQTLTDQNQATARTNIGAFAISGGSIDGDVNVVGNVSISNQAFDGTTPQSSLTTSIEFIGSSDSIVTGSVKSTIDISNSTNVSLNATNVGTNTTGSIGIIIGNDGTVNTYAPNPSPQSSNTNIATTSWTNSRISDSIDCALAPKASKTYQNVQPTAGTFDDGQQYVIVIKPNDYNTPWAITFHGDVTCGYTDLNQSVYGQISGVGSQITYGYYVVCRSGDIAFDGIVVATANPQSYTTGHYVGFSIGLATNPTTDGYQRTIAITVTNQDNCSVSCPDSPITSLSQDTHNTPTYVSTKSSGLYYNSTINYGDRLSIWDRIAAAGSANVQSNTIVGDDINGNIVPLYNGQQWTSIAIRPYSLSFYDGVDLTPGEVNTTGGTLYNVHRFDCATAFGYTTPFNPNDRIYLRGTLDQSTWMFTANQCVTSLPTTDDGAQYLFVGYPCGDGTTNGYLSYAHPIYQFVNQAPVEISPIPVVSTPPLSSNDDTIATTSFVQQVAGNASATSLIDPIINTNYPDGNDIVINAYQGSYTRGGDVSEPVDQTIVFKDGSQYTSHQDYVDHAVSYIGHHYDQTLSRTFIHAIKPDQTGDSVVTGINVGYYNDGANWQPTVTLTDNPPQDSNDSSIATTSWVNQHVGRFVVCSTAAEIPSKTINVTGVSKTTGSRVVVMFVNGSTVDNPTLNVNGTGDAPIQYLGENVSRNDIIANAVIDLVFDGTNWQVIGTLPGHYAQSTNPVFTGTLSIE